VQILVTGARGFIGTRLLPRLRDRGATVSIYEEKIQDLASWPDRCDVLIHLAARPGRENNPGESLETLRANVLGTLAAAEYARRVSCSVVFTSTCAVYQEVVGSVRMTEGQPLAPRGLNGLSKLLAEEALGSASRLHGFPVTVLRLFNVYGPAQPRGFLVADVLHAIAARQPIPFRNPRAVLDFIYVDDVCEAIWRAAERMPRAGVRAFNIGTGRGATGLEVARTMLRLAGARPEQVDLEPLAREETFVVADPSAAERDLGWKAQVDLVTGLTATLAAGETAP